MTTNTSATATSGVGADEPGKVSLKGIINPSTPPAANEPPTPQADEPTPSQTPTTVGEFETQLGGQSFDAAGNLLDKDGAVLLTAAELAAKKAQAVDAPEPSFSIAESGDLVNEKGEVVAKVGEFEVAEDGTVSFKDVPVIEQLKAKAKELGYQIDDKAEFGDDADGFFEFAGHLAEQLYTQQTIQLFEQHPALLGLYQHLQAGGLPEDYYKNHADDVDYNQLEVPVEQKARRVEIIRQYLTKVANNEPEVTEEMLKFIEDGGKVNELYDKAITGLRKHQEETKAAQAAATAAAIKEQEESEAAHWKTVAATIKKGELGQMVIPDNERDNYFKFLAVKDKDGYTAAQKAVAEMPLEERLQLQYILYGVTVKKQSLADLAANFKTTAATNKILLKQSANPLQVKVPPKVTKPGDARVSLKTIR